MSLGYWYRRIVKWQWETFPDATLESALIHLEREVKELRANPSGEEWADVQHLLFAVAARLGIDPVEELRAKHLINVTRTWGEPDSEGVQEHV